MSEVIDLLSQKLELNDLHFMSKPILIGGMAMEYYGLRKSGADIDLKIISYEKSNGVVYDGKYSDG